MSGETADPPTAETRFVLFVAGDSANSRAATANLRRALDAAGHTMSDVEVVDVYERPEAAANARVLVTPALILRSNPRLRVLGDLSAKTLLENFLSTP